VKKVVVLAAMLALTGAATGCSGIGGNSDEYDIFYESFVSQMRMQANWAIVNGVSYREQCEEYFNMDLLTANVDSGAEGDYVQACIDASNRVFGPESQE